MVKRHEIKYIISSLEAEALKRRLSLVLNKDRNCQMGSYEVSSLYFDNYYDQAYREKNEGLAQRHKFRIRYYNGDTSHLKLERKSKFDQMTSKVSAPFTEKEIVKIYKGQYDFLLFKEGELYHEFYKALTHDLMRPKVIIKYQRQAFVHPVGKVRITLDERIQTSLNEVDIFKTKIPYSYATEQGQCILEIKFNHYLPEYITSLMDMGQAMQESSSKYVFGTNHWF